MMSINQPDWHNEAAVERYEVAEYGHDFYMELPVESWAPWPNSSSSSISSAQIRQAATQFRPLFLAI